MAKTSYKVPVALNRTFMDLEITMSGKGWNLRPSPLKQLLFYGGTMFLLLPWLVTSTFISSAGFVLITFFIIWFIVTFAYLGRLTRTKDLTISAVPALMAYLPPRARHILTRRSSNPSEFYGVVGIDSIDDDGRINFAGGDVGRTYLVVGSASHLLFDADREAILDRTEAFWNKTEPSCEWSWLTTKEPQRVHHQLANLERRNRALEIRHPDLLELQNESFDLLTQHVGGAFSSIHQYLVLRGTSQDALTRGHKLLHAEVEASSLMIKESAELDRLETLQVLQVLYQGTPDELSELARAGGRPDRR